MNSHAAEEEDFSPMVPRAIYMGNEAADEAAKAAAAKHSVAQHLVDELAAHYAKATMVMERLVAVAIGAASGRSHAKPRPEDQGAAREGASSSWAARLQTAVCQTTHRLRASPGGKWLCEVCWGRSPATPKGKYDWLLRGCGAEEGKSSRPHGSHQLRLQGESVTVFCAACGSWSTSVYRGLRRACPGMPATGLQRLCLRRLSLGKGPPGTDFAYEGGPLAGQGDGLADELHIEGVDEASDHSD